VVLVVAGLVVLPMALLVGVVASQF